MFIGDSLNTYTCRIKHLSPAGRMHIAHPHAKLGSCLTRMKNRTGNIMKFEIKKNLTAFILNGTNNLRPMG